MLTNLTATFETSNHHVILEIRIVDGASDTHTHTHTLSPHFPCSPRVSAYLCIRPMQPDRVLRAQHGKHIFTPSVSSRSEETYMMLRSLVTPAARVACARQVNRLLSKEFPFLVFHIHQDTG